MNSASTTSALENIPAGTIGKATDDDSAESSRSETDEPLQTGSRKRKRGQSTNVTCEACKQRKVKCDRAHPSCGWCARNHHLCEYKERRKPGLRAGYGRQLESRLDRLEAALKEHGRQLSAHLQGTCQATVLTSGLTSDPDGNSLPSNDVVVLTSPAYMTDNAASTQVIASERHKPFDSLRSGQRQSAAATTCNSSRQEAGGQHPSPTLSHSLTSPHSTATFQRPSELYTELVAPLPPYDLLCSLVELYFGHINVWFALLDQKSTLDTLFGPSLLAEADKVLLHAIVATALRFSDDARLTPESRRHYHTTSKQKVQLFGIENTNVRSLQALVILALDITGTTNGPPAWNMLSLISRSVVQLGLATESASSLNMPVYPSIATLRAAVLPEARSSVEDEERRRLFWGIFQLDRYTTIATAFEFALDEREIDRRLPCRDDYFLANRPVETRWFRHAARPQHDVGMGDVHGHFSYHCELLVILGRIHQFLKRPVDIGSITDVEQWQGSYRTLDGDLNAWHFNLPDDFAGVIRLSRGSMLAKVSHCGWIMLHAAYYLTVIRLNSSAAYPSHTSTIFSSSYSAMQRCLSAVDSLKQLAQLVSLSGLLDRVGPSFAFAAWVAARVMLVHGSTIDHEVDPDIDLFVALLGEMGRYWDVAQRYGDILERVLQEYRASQKVGTTGRVTPSTVKILADMRRCAFDLDFLISRQPSVGTKSHHPTRANSPQPNEFEYLDVFDLFNFPRLPVPQYGSEHPVQGAGVDHTHMATFGITHNALTIPNFAVPDPDADWLFHRE